MLPPIAPFLNPKHVLRERMKGERRAAAKARPDAATHAASNFLSSITVPNDAVVSLYYPIKDELDTEPLAAAMTEKNITIALPITGGKKQPLTFRRYAPGDHLIPGAYGEKNA